MKLLIWGQKFQEFTLRVYFARNALEFGATLSYYEAV